MCEYYRTMLYPDSKAGRTGLPGYLQEGLAVLTDEVLLVVAGDVVPHHPVSVEVVQHSQAGLVMLPLHLQLPVI